jgi:ubiquinone/menaquinone biosynthesis C-methylase UbiE
MQRRPSAELLDSDSGTPAEVAASLRDLRWFNEWFGGTATSCALVEAVVRRSGRSQLSLLEVAAGDGYVPHTVAARIRHSGVRLNVTLLDRASSHLPTNGTLPKVSADALLLPFTNSSFDLVSASLFVHHLAPDQAVQFAREALRVCACAVLVNDLVRHPLHLAIAYAGMPFYRSRITRNDAPASVRQAYTVREMQDIFDQAGSSRVEVQCHYLFRMGVTAWKHGPPDDL